MSSNPYRKRLGPTTEANYRRALAAEPQLRAVDHLVTTMCTFVRPSDSLCHGCAWKRMVKPLVTRLVGWERGMAYTAHDPDPDDGATLKVVNLGALMDEHDQAAAHRPPADTDTERWMRGQEAYNAV